MGTFNLHFECLSPAYPLWVLHTYGARCKQCGYDYRAAAAGPKRLNVFDAAFASKKYREFEEKTRCVYTLDFSMFCSAKCAYSWLLKNHPAEEDNITFFAEEIANDARNSWLHLRDPATLPWVLLISFVIALTCAIALSVLK